MEVQAVSFTGGQKTAQKFLNKSQKSFGEAMESALSHSNKDYFNLTNKSKTVSNAAVNTSEKAKEFFAPAIKSVQEFFKQV